MSSQPLRALISITSYNGVFYDGGKRTGLYWSEALHPFNVFRDAGIDVEVASETGTMGYDEHSLEGDALDPESKGNAPLHEVSIHNRLHTFDDCSTGIPFLLNLGKHHASQTCHVQRPGRTQSTLFVAC